MSRRYDPKDSVEGKSPNIQLETDASIFGKNIQQVRLDSNRVTDPVAEFAYSVVKRFSLPARVDALLLDTAIQFGLFSILADLLTVPMIGLNIAAGLTLLAILSLMAACVWFDSRTTPFVAYRIIVIVLAMILTISGNIAVRLG